MLSLYSTVGLYSCDETMGVITLVGLQEGVTFGPIPTIHMFVDPAYMIAHTTMDVLPSMPVIYVSQILRLSICNRFECIAISNS